MSTTVDLLDARVELLEEVVNNVQTALINVASTEALNQIILLVQESMQDLRTDVDQLRRELDIVKAEVFR